MNAKEIRNLQEAYLGVYDSQEKLDEISDRLARATTKKRERDVEKTLSNYDSDKSRMLATQISAANRNKNLMKDREKRKEKLGEQVDLYDIILSHLLDEGYADNEQAALAIMANMSEEWRESVVEAKKKVKIHTDKPIEYKIADIGPGKKEYNVKTSKGWKD